MEFKFHDHKFENIGRWYDVIRSAMNELGHTENPDKADIHFYNHIENNGPSDENIIIVKPTAPTSKHFALDKLGYANASELAYKEPILNDDIEQMDWQSIIMSLANGMQTIDADYEMIVSLYILLFVLV